MLKSVLRIAAHTISLTLLTWVVCSWLFFDLASLDTFAPITQQSDFQIADIYTRIANRRQVRQLSRNVAVVTTDDCNRIEIAELLQQLATYKPQAIGLDIVFPFTTENDSLLLRVLSSTPNLIVPIRITDMKIDSCHFFKDLCSVQYGAINLCAQSPRSVVREFYPFLVSGNDTIPYFATELSRLVNPTAYQHLLERHLEREPIAYASIEVPCLSGRELLDNKISQDRINWLLTHSVILLGDTSIQSDHYNTPLGKAVPGVILHAYALHTILSEQFIDTTSNSANWLFAILFCLLFSLINILSNFYLDRINGLVIRLVQISMLFSLIIIGTGLFIHQHISTDFSPSLLMIGLNALALDIWLGLCKLGEWTVQFFYQLKTRYL